ncbi:MAG: hypothetical protein JXM69_21495 [Anaerolineae bacterium]|nr:hypothetical protein [Anaerolineae bacterium]
MNNSGTRTIRFLGNLLRVFAPLLLLVLILVVLTTMLTVTSSQFSEVLRAVAFKLVWFGAAFGFVLFAISILASRFISAVYDLGSASKGLGFLIRFLFGQSGFRPYLLINQGKITAGDKAIKKTGGPAGLVIHNDTAVVLDQKGRLTRIEGPGLASLEPHEKVYDMVDLRPKRWVLPVNAMTREGIPITWDVEICYQIDNGNQPSTERVPYPFLPEAVLRAATSKWRRERGRDQELNWEGRVVVGAAEGTLRSILARRSLDELIGLTEAEQIAAREAIQEELAAALHKAAPDVGARILSVKLQKLQLEDKITEQWIGAWKARWQSWSTHQLTPKEAERIAEYEKAKADAHILGLNALTAVMQELDQVDQEVVLMRLSSVLDRGTMGMASRMFFPGQAMGAMGYVREMSERGHSEEEENKPGQENDDDAAGGNVARARIGPGPGPHPESVKPFYNFEIILPLFDAIAAGKETPILDDIQGYVRQVGEFEFEIDNQRLLARPLRGQSRLVFAEDCKYMVMEVAGDSMDQAGIAPGDYVILQRKGVGAAQPSSDDIVAVVYHDEKFYDEVGTATLKRIAIRPDGVTLIPESSNPVYQPRTIPRQAFAGDHPQVELVGIAIAVLNRPGK